jgi:hypothetical protein
MERLFKVILYIIKELVLKLSSKFYASGGNVTKLRRITWLPKREKKRERERERAENKNPGVGGSGGTLARHG